MDNHDRRLITGAALAGIIILATAGIVGAYDDAPPRPSTDLPGPVIDSTSNALDVPLHDSTTVTRVVPCANDEGSVSAHEVLPCYWDASIMGNGHGTSFVLNVDGSFSPIGTPAPPTTTEG